ncbi:hypothetical protein GBAR_LOCUS27740 [Geodia barretti]|uniref:Uncharacterized protein n=1 Tax=Geodia barretti TaxID=519541 RepID=A0AA35XGF4_GEOBA|nr:hypothetical protein GBAR_LOCUS27740 [Geodia barretti]
MRINGDSLFIRACVNWQIETFSSRSSSAPQRQDVGAAGEDEGGLRGPSQGRLHHHVRPRRAGSPQKLPDMGTRRKRVYPLGIR